GGGGQLKQFLCLGKYDMEFVKEDGVWKFFKFAYRLTFMCPYEKGWVEEPVGGSIAGSPENIPDKPTTYFMPYSRHRINIMQPPPPEPYRDLYFTLPLKLRGYLHHHAISGKRIAAAGIQRYADQVIG
ncbi:MAG: hypothetical protein ACYDG5_04945, partial [Dehalococcoidales bacterium]